MPPGGQVLPARPGASPAADRLGRAGGGERGALVCRGLSGLAARAAALGLATIGLRLRGRDGDRRLPGRPPDGDDRRRAAREAPRLHGLPGRGPLRRAVPARIDRSARAGRVADDRPRAAHPRADAGRSARRVHRSLRGQEGRSRAAGARRAGRLRAHLCGIRGVVPRRRHRSVGLRGERIRRGARGPVAVVPAGGRQRADRGMEHRLAFRRGRGGQRLPGDLHGLGRPA